MEPTEKIRWVYRIILNVSAFALWFWRPRWRNTYWKWLPLYVTAIALSEWMGLYMRTILPARTWNPILYSFIIHPGIFIFLFWVLGKYDNEQRRRNRLWGIFSIVVCAACITDFYLFSGQKLWFSSFSYLIGALLLCILLVRFFIQYMFSNHISGFKSDTIFWFCCVLFVYYMGTFPFFALRNTLADQYYYEIFEPYFYIQITLAAVMYFLFFIIYSCTRPK